MNHTQKDAGGFDMESVVERGIAMRMSVRNTDRKSMDSELRRVADMLYAKRESDARVALKALKVRMTRAPHLSLAAIFFFDLEVYLENGQCDIPTMESIIRQILAVKIENERLSTRKRRDRRTTCASNQTHGAIRLAYMREMAMSR